MISFLSESLGRYVAEEATLEEIQKYLDGFAESVPKGAPASDFADPPDGLYVGDAKHARLAVQAVTGGLRGNKAKNRGKPGVKAKIAAAVRKFYSGEAEKYYLTWLNTGKKPANRPVTEIAISTPHYSTDNERTFPEVPNCPGVDIARLTLGDNNPLFVTRPLGILGSVSENGLEYDDRMLDDIYQQVASKRPPARMGHVAESNRGSEFPPDQGLWIGVLDDKAGTVFGKRTIFGKCYLLPGSTLREMVPRRDAAGTPLSNSIWGGADLVDAEGGNVRSLSTEIESIDFVPAERAALQDLGGKFDLTSEMKGVEDMAEGHDDAAQDLAMFKSLVAKMKPEALHEMLRETGQIHHVAEAHMREAKCAECSDGAVHDMLSESRRAHIAKSHLKELSAEEVNSALTPPQRKAIAETYMSELGVNTKDGQPTVREEEEESKKVREEETKAMSEMKTSIAEMQTTIKRYEREEFERSLDNVVGACFIDWHTNTIKGQEVLGSLKKNLRIQAVAEMAGSTKLEDIKAAVDKAWETIKPLAEVTKANLAGPSAFVGVAQMNGGGPVQYGFDRQAGRYDDEIAQRAAAKLNLIG